jgi:hypothetical protein
VYDKLREEMEEFDFRCYGCGCTYGAITGTSKEIAKVVKQAGFVFHVKPQGDGYGHIYHNAYACGKPVIYKSEYLSQTGVSMTPLLLFDDETSIDLSKLSIKDAVSRIKEMSDNYSYFSDKVIAKFRTTVDFEKEFIEIKKFVENLV